MSLKSLAIVAFGKYLAQNFKAISSHVVMVSGSMELSHTLALSLSENGNNLRHIVLSVMSVCLKVSQISKKIFICQLSNVIVY